MSAAGVSVAGAAGAAQAQPCALAEVYASFAQALAKMWAPIERAAKSWVDAAGLVHGVYLLGYVPAAPNDAPYCDPQIGVTVVWWEPLQGPGKRGCWVDSVGEVTPSHWVPLAAVPAVARPGGGR